MKKLECRNLLNAGLLSRAVVMAAGLLLPASAFAAADWTGGAGTGDWATASNWNHLPAANESVNFGATAGTTTLNNNLAAGYALASINLTSAAPAYTLQGNGITLGGNIQNASSNLQRIHFDMILTNTLHNVALQTGGGDVELNGAISGLGGMQTSGAGTLTLNGANSFAGGVLLNSNKTLKIGQASALGTGTLTLAGGTFDNSSGAAMTISNAMNLNNGLANVFTGTRDMTVSGVVLLTGSNTARTLSVANAGATLTLEGGLSDNGGGSSFVKSGAGTIVLKGVGSYTAATTVTGGTLLANNASGSATGSGGVNVNAGTFGGTGSIAGLANIGDGAGGKDSYLAAGSNGVGTLTLAGGLTMKSDSTLRMEIDSATGLADQIVAAGVTIDANADFSLLMLGTSAIGANTSFVAINNTAASAISGTFRNLAEGSTLVVGAYEFNVSYLGGDGNDFVLTSAGPAIPEPASALTLLAVPLLVGLRRGRRVVG